MSNELIEEVDQFYRNKRRMPNAIIRDDIEKKVREQVLRFYRTWDTSELNMNTKMRRLDSMDRPSIRAITNNPCIEWDIRDIPNYHGWRIEMETYIIWRVKEITSRPLTYKDTRYDEKGRLNPIY